jgi:two-component system sensor histidine kinase HydH
VLFEPLRDKLNAYIHKAFLDFGGLEQAVSGVRTELAHVLDVGQMLPVVMDALDRSRRFTAAALYLREATSGELYLAQALGPSAPPTIQGAALHALTERLASSPSVLLEEVERDVSIARSREGQTNLEAEERVLSAAELLGPFRRGLCVRVRGSDSELVGILLAVDERVHDAFSEEDVTALESLCIQVAIVVENSREHLKLQERVRLAALGQMAAGLAHEIKNPLGAIKGAAQLLQSLGGDDQRREFVDIIVEETERLNRVVGSVLDYARPTESQLSVFDVNHVVDRTVQLLAVDDEFASVRTSFGKELGRVRADAEKLRQVLINLIRNGVQAMNGAGEVTVATRVRAASPLSSGLVEIAVSDQGPGVPEHARQSLFVPFFTTKRGGTGLGLAICDRIVREMGGRIEVSSEPGQGATFRVLLPMVGGEV